MLRECTRLAPCGMGGYLTLLARPRLWLQDKRGQPLLTDLILRSYALQLRKVTGEHPRVFDLSAEGLPIGAAPIETLGELIELCGTSPQETAGPAESPKADVAGLRLFYEQEQELLSEVVRRIHEPDPNLSQTLAPVEYLRLSLPEADPQRALGSTDLSRIEGLARLLSLLLERTRSALNDAP